MTPSNVPSPGVVIVDDTPATLRDMTMLLGAKGFTAVPAANEEEALAALPAAADAVAFVLLDHVIEGRPERGTALLKTIRHKRPGAFVVMYTADGRIEPSQRWLAMAAGAHRYIRKGNAKELLADIEDFVRDMTDLLDLTLEFERLTRERPTTAFDIAGLDLPLAVIDREYRVWIANVAQEELVGGGAVTGAPCWNLFHGAPVERGPCIRCPVTEVLDGADSATDTYLARNAAGELAWLEAHAVPLLARGVAAHRRVIAVKKTSQPLGPRVHALDRARRLRLIARGIVQDGFGRARIYEVRQGGRLRCVGAAAGPDRTADEQYQSTAVGYETSLETNATAKAAFDARRPIVVGKAGGLAVGTEIELGLEPPWIDYPIFLDGQLLGWLGVDVAGAERRELGERDIEALRPFAAEVRDALHEGTLPFTRAIFARGVVANARLQVGAADRPMDALDAILEAVVTVVPESFTWIRSHEGGSGGLLRLLAEKGVNLGRPSLAVAEEEQESRAAAAYRSREPFFIPDLEDYRKRRLQDPSLPAGLSNLNGQALAVLPLLVEWQCFGTLAIETREPLRWDTEGVRQPLLELASLAALVVRDLRRARQLEDARLAEREAAMAFGAVHAFKGPAQALRNYLESINTLHEKGVLTSGKASELATRARTCVLRIERLAERLLRLVRQKRDEAQPVDLRGAIETCLNEGRTLYPGLKLTAEVDPAVTTVIAVGEDLLAVLDELLTNAAKATKEKGTVTIRAERDGEFVSLVVEDDGCGATDEQLPRMFDRWVSDFPSGTGLGLPFVRKAIEEVGGAVNAVGLPRGMKIQVRLRRGNG